MEPGNFMTYVTDDYVTTTWSTPGDASRTLHPRAQKEKLPADASGSLVAQLLAGVDAALDPGVDGLRTLAATRIRGSM